ncbi:MAG TPA: hypothetical protein VKA67_08220, partial [Verrucomicrobiae bacterium]|nr:hypothetical protein [Verrucomicrobiae bacterium]
MAAPYSLEVEDSNLGGNHVVSGENEDVTRAQADALARTRQQEFELEQFQNILRPRLSVKHAVDWEKLKRHDEYPAPKPPEVVYREFPPEPKPDDPCYRLTSTDTVTAADTLNQQKTRELQERYVRDYTAWAETVREVETENQRRYAECMAAVEDWNNGLLKHRKVLAEYNSAVEKRKADYASLQPDAVERYFREVLSASPLPEKFTCEFDLQYVPEAKSLIVEHLLPTPAVLPRIKEVKYLEERCEFVSLPFSNAALSRIYADIVYQICFRTLYELFDADTADALHGVFFTGWVKAVAKSNGAKTRICVLSVAAQKQRFQALNLWDTDAKDCFKSLGGEGNPTVTALVPVQPALKITR